MDSTALAAKTSASWPGRPEQIPSEERGSAGCGFKEKRGKAHEVPVHSKAREAIDQWLTASAIGSNSSAPIFPAFGKDKKTLELRHMDRRSIW